MGQGTKDGTQDLIVTSKLQQAKARALSLTITKLIFQKPCLSLEVDASP
jgi:hypothetical protein